MTSRDRLAPLLASMSLAWCLLIGAWFWVTPIEYEGSINGVPTVHHQSFSDISLLGPAPLIVPVLIAAIAVWATWRSRKAVLALAAFLLVAFTFVSGFSIGGGYIPASAMLLAALWACNLN